jgi:hypothetical protein
MARRFQRRKGIEVSSPTQRSLKKLRDAGYMAAVTERFNSFTKRRHDLFEFIDILAVKQNEVIGVQTTSQSNVGARIKKICALQSADSWLYGGTRRIVVHGWAKRGPRGKAKRWTCTETEITADQVSAEGEK